MRLNDFFLITVSGLDMNITQFLKSLGLEHLRDIFETEQVSVKCFLCFEERLQFPDFKRERKDDFTSAGKKNRCSNECIGKCFSVR